MQRPRPYYVMNPYQHSDVAVSIYKVLCEDDLVKAGEQGHLGTLACKIAQRISNDFGLELQPVEEG